MPKKRYEEFKKINKIYFALIISLVSIFAVVFLAASMYSSMLRGSQSISNVLAEQKALVESMAKDTNRLVALRNSPIDRLSETEISERENSIKSALLESTTEYNNNIENLASGLVVTPQGKYEIWTRNIEVMDDSIDQNVSIWNQLSDDYNTILSADPNSDIYIDSLISINQNSDKLFDASEAVLDNFLSSNINSYSHVNGIIVLVVGLAGLVLFILVYESYKYMFLPMKELYIGFKEIGFDSLTRDDDHGIDSISNNIRKVLYGVVESLNLTQKLNSTNSFDDMLKYIYESFKDYIPYSHIGIALFKDDDSDIIIGSYGINDERIDSNTISDIIGYQASIYDTSLYKIIESREARIIDNLEYHVRYKSPSTYNNILLNAGVKSSITLPLIINDLCIGFIFFSSDRADVYREDHLKFLDVLRDSISIAFQKNIFVEDLLYSNLISLTKISESKDKETGNHILRMKEYSTKLAKLMKKSPVFSDRIDYKFIIDIEKFSPMHDIGKVSIPDSILLKPGKLTVEEFDTMKTHTTSGAKVLLEAESQLKRSQRNVFTVGIEIAQSHHERWDGSGYPKGLSGEDIPLSGRIVALADVLDALLSRRPYKEPFSFEKAREIILEGRGTHFDPDIVDIFDENIDRFKSIYSRYKKEYE